jgi:hypothetical protein
MPSSWFLRTAEGLPRDRFGVFDVRSDAHDPAGVVVRVTNFPDQEPKLDAQERGRATALAAAAVVARRVPRCLGRFSAEGLPAAVEEAAAGVPLSDLVAAPSPDRSRKLALVAGVCSWLEEVAAATRAPARALEAARQSVRRRVVPTWLEYGAAEVADLDRELDGTPATFEHGDLHPGNVLHDGSTFRVVDFDRVRRDGFPLWDLWLFLAHALVLLDTPRTGGRSREAEMLRLFRGELPSSPLLFDWSRRVAAAAEVPAHAVGPLATLLWLDRGIPEWLAPPDAPRPDWVGAWSAGTTPVELLLRRRRSFTVVATRWLADPALGPAWTALPRA